LVHVLNIKLAVNSLPEMIKVLRKSGIIPFICMLANNMSIASMKNILMAMLARPKVKIRKGQDKMFMTGRKKVLISPMDKPAIAKVCHKLFIATPGMYLALSHKPREPAKVLKNRA